MKKHKQEKNSGNIGLENIKLNANEIKVDDKKIIGTKINSCKTKATRNRGPGNDLTSAR